MPANLHLPERLQDSIAANDPVRFLDAFAASLDVRTLGFAHALVQYTGLLRRTKGRLSCKRATSNWSGIALWPTPISAALIISDHPPSPTLR